MHRRIDKAEVLERKAHFAAAGFVRVPDFLQPDIAEQCSDLADAISTWRTAFSETGGCERYVGVGQITSVMAEAVADRARSEFQFNFDLCELTEEGGEELPPPWRRLREYLLSPSFRSLCAEIGGLGDVVAADAIVSRISPQQFVGLHWDRHPDQDRIRRMAFVLSLMRDWGPDWGGATLLWDGAFSEAKAIRPQFNSMLLFAVPQPHSIEPVAHFVARPRVVVSGFIYCTAPVSPST